MIEGIFQIGNFIKKGKKVSQIATDIPNLKEGYTYKIGKINFNLKDKSIEFDLTEEYESGKEEDYRFIQLKLTGRQNQFFSTFTDIKRFTGEVDNRTGTSKPYAVWLSIENELSELCSQINDERLKDKIKDFLKDLKKVKEIFYEDYIVDVSKIKDFTGKDISEVKRFLKSQLGRKEDIVFYTVLINGEKVVEKDFYDELIKKKVIYDKRKKGSVVCSVCSTSACFYFDDHARLPLKFFINDKVGFSQKLSDRWEGNFVLCEDCYLSLFAGEKFLLNNFTERIGIINFLIIPEFLDKVPVTHQKLKDWVDLTKDLYNPFGFFDENRLKSRLEEYRKYGFLKYFLLNYIFYEQKNAQFKIFTVIKDIPRERLDKIRDVLNNYRIKIVQNFPEISDVILRSYGDVYWLIPLRYSKADNRIIDIPKVTHLFSNILNGNSVNIDSLVHDFWLGAKAKYFKNQSYHIVDSPNNEPQLKTDGKLTKYILKTHQLLILFGYLNLVNGGCVMDLSGLSEELKKYIKNVNFNEKQAALFLLGTLIGDIGSRQAKYGSKPILNKINFQGMSIDRIQMLFNEVYQKLQQEKLLYPEEELIYEKAKELFDKNLKNWDLKPYENVYFLLSGYAFKTKLNIERAKQKEEVL